MRYYICILLILSLMGCKPVSHELDSTKVCDSDNNCYVLNRCGYYPLTSHTKCNIIKIKESTK